MLLIKKYYATQQPPLIFFNLKFKPLDYAVWANMKKYVWLQRPRTEADLRAAITSYHVQMGQPGRIQNETVNASFRNRLLTCIHREGKRTDNKKWRLQAQRLNDAESAQPEIQADFLTNAAEANDEELETILLEFIERINYLAKFPINA